MEEKTIKYIYWIDNHQFIGYLDQFPDYLTQGDSLSELETNLVDLYKDLNNNEIPFVRKSGEIRVA